jgi:hypothetical protein
MLSNKQNCFLLLASWSFINEDLQGMKRNVSEQLKTGKLRISNPWVAGSSPAGRDRIFDSDSKGAGHGH